MSVTTEAYMQSLRGCKFQLRFAVENLVRMEIDLEPSNAIEFADNHLAAFSHAWKEVLEPQWLHVGVKSYHYRSLAALRRVMNRHWGQAYEFRNVASARILNRSVLRLLERTSDVYNTLASRSAQ